MKTRHYIIVITSLIILLSANASIAPSVSLVECSDSGHSNFSMADSIYLMPHFINEDSRDTQFLRKQLVKGDNPIVRHSFYYSMYFQEVQELLKRANLYCENEYADGTVIRDSLMDSTGSFTPGDMVLTAFNYCAASDERFMRNVSEDKYVVNLDKVKHQYTLEYEVSFEIDDSNPWIYADMKSLNGMRFVKIQNADFWNSKTLSEVLEYGRSIYQDSGKDPDNFKSEYLHFSPSVGYHFTGEHYGEENHGVSMLYIKGQLGLLGRIYCEGGFDANCKTMVITEIPSDPEFDYNIVNIGRVGNKYMDSWRMTVTMKTTQYGYEFITNQILNVYLPYPSNDEDRAAAHEAGYVF